jgi:hypothetical protein
LPPRHGAQQDVKNRSDVRPIRVGGNTLDNVVDADEQGSEARPQRRQARQLPLDDVARRRAVDREVGAQNQQAGRQARDELVRPAIRLGD